MECKDLPIGTKMIMAIWSFKHKRCPDGTLNKHKARLCAHDGQQTWGQDYWDTYAPIVTWASVRLLLIVAKVHGLQSKCINFVLSFPQGDLDVPVYMELPAGVNPVNISDENQCRYVIKVNKSLYGLGQAGYNWFEKLWRDKLLEISFRVKLTSAYFFGKIELFSLTLMTALSLGRQWWTLTLLSHCSTLLTRNFNMWVKAV
jgi:hypothetical protein